MSPQIPTSDFTDYAGRLAAALQAQDWSGVADLANELHAAWKEGRRVYICGNGGSAANAIHWANDMLFVIARSGGPGLAITALPANQAVLTCLGNDIGYENIFSHQLDTFGKKGDVLIAMSGSGNSPNIVKVLEKSRALGMKSYALLGFSGGVCKPLADVVIHFAVNDMQIVEDLQLAVCHMLAQSLAKQSHTGK
jgi:D-sedoheptulose 7-phosphate isomerase